MQESILKRSFGTGKMVKYMTFLAYLMSHGHVAPTLPQPFALESGAFKNMTVIPERYSCLAGNQTLPFHWQGIPNKTQSLVLIMSDQDAPQYQRYHWTLYNILPTEQRLTASLSTLPLGAVPAQTSWGDEHYHGPCQSDHKMHRYHFDLYALDTRLPVPANTATEQIKQAMQGHVLAHAELTGLYRS